MRRVPVSERRSSCECAAQTLDVRGSRAGRLDCGEFLDAGTLQRELEIPVIQGVEDTEAEALRADGRELGRVVGCGACKAQHVEREFEALVRVGEQPSSLAALVFQRQAGDVRADLCLFNGAAGGTAVEYVEVQGEQGGGLQDCPGFAEVADVELALLV